MGVVLSLCSELGLVGRLSELGYWNTACILGGRDLEHTQLGHVAFVLCRLLYRITKPNRSRRWQYASNKRFSARVPEGILLSARTKGKLEMVYRHNVM